MELERKGTEMPRDQSAGEALMKRTYILAATKRTRREDGFLGALDVGSWMWMLVNYSGWTKGAVPSDQFMRQ